VTSPRPWRGRADSLGAGTGCSAHNCVTVAAALSFSRLPAIALARPHRRVFTQEDLHAASRKRPASSWGARARAADLDDPRGRSPSLIYTSPRSRQTHSLHSARQHLPVHGHPRARLLFPTREQNNPTHPLPSATTLVCTKLLAFAPARRRSAPPRAHALPSSIN
jgi:hypothetical protein